MRAHIVGMLARNGLAAIALAFACALCFAPSAAADQASADVVVWQKLKTDQLNGVDKTFDYRLEAITPQAPMPEGAVEGVYDWAMTSDETKVLTVRFDAPLSGTFEYRMLQRVEVPKEGYTYDDTVYLMRLYPIGDEADGAMLIVYDAQGQMKQPDPGWTVVYESAPAEGGGEGGEEEAPEPPQSIPQMVSSLAETADALDITVLVVLVVCAGAGVAVSLRKRTHAADAHIAGASGADASEGRDAR